MTCWINIALAFAAGSVAAAMAIGMAPDRPEPRCASRDMAATERAFAACLDTMTRRASAHVPAECRREAEKLACTSWEPSRDAQEDRS